MAELAVVGRIVRAHGIRGAVIARPEADGSDVLLRVPELTLGHRGRQEPRQVLHAQWQAKQILLQLAGVPDRNAAEALVGAEILLSPEMLPEPEEGEYYLGDLVGLEVVAKDGRSFGRVTGLESSPVQHWLVVDVQGRQVLCPFTEGLVCEVDEENRRIVVDPPEGLFDGESVG